jgi:hypothetical protein
VSGGIAPLLTSALDGGEWSALCSVVLSMGKNPGTHQLGGREVTAADLSRAALLGLSGCSIQYLSFYTGS